MNGPELDLSAANAAAATYLADVRTQATATPTVDTPAPASIPAAPLESTPAAQLDSPTPAPTTPAPSPLNPDDFVDVEIEPGKTIKVSKDGKDGYLRLADYTRKTQEAARIRKEAETAYEKLQQEASEFREFLNNPAAVAQFLAEQASNNTPPTPSTPDELITRQDLQAERAQMLREHQENLQSTIANLENARKVESMRTEFDKTVTDVLAKHSVLLEYHDVEEIAQLLKMDAGKAKPQSVEDVKSAIAKAAEARAKKLTSHVESLRQKQAIADAEKVRKGIEPPGGLAPQPVPTTFKLGSKDLIEAATRMLQQTRRK